MDAWRNERGAGALKNIILLAVVGYGLFVAIKIVAARGDDATLEKRVEETLKYASATERKMNANDIRYQVSKDIKQADVPVDPEKDVKVIDEGSRWRVQFSYERKVPLVFWTYQKKIEIDKSGPK